MAERVIKTTIQLDGEKAFKAAIQSVNSEMKVFDSELKLVTAKFGTADQGMKGLRATAEVLTKKVEAQREKVAALKTAVSDSGEAYKKAKEKYAAAERKLEETTAAFGENSEEARRAAAELNSTATAVKKAEKAYDNYQIQLNNTQAELIQTTEQLKKTSTEAKSLKNIRLKDLMPPEVAEKVEKVAKAFAKVSTEAGKAAAAAAKIGAQTIRKSFDLSAKALAAYAGAAGAAATAIVNLTTSAGAAADDLNTLSKQTGLTTSDLQKMQYAASLIDVDVDTVTKSMAKLTKNMTSTSKTVTGAFEELGVSVRDDLTGELRDNQEVFSEIITALGKVENETELDSLAMSIFGKSAQDLKPLILGGADALKQLGDEAEAAGLILSQDALDNLNAYNDSVDTLKASTSAAGKVIATNFAPRLKTVTDLLGKNAPTIADSFGKMFSGDKGAASKFREQIKSLTTDLVKNIKGMLPDLLAGMNTVILSIGENVPTAVVALLPDFITGLKNLANDIVDQIPTVAPTILQGGIDLFNGLIGGLNDVISRLTPMLPGIVQDLGDKIIESAPVILDTGADLLTNLITGITTVLPKLGEKAAELVPVVTGKLKEDVPKILQAGVDLLSDFISGILSEVPTLVTEAAGLVQTIIDSLLSTDNLAKILQAGLDLIGALANSLPVAIPALLDVIPGIIDSIIGAFLKTDWLKTGTQIFSGLGKAITNIISKLSEIIPKLVKTITSKENISKTIKAAADLVKALAKSLKDSLPEIIKAVGEIISAIITAFSEIDWLETGKEIFSAFGDALVSIFSEGLGIIDGLLGTNLQQWYDDITAFWYDAGAKLYEVLNAEKIQSTEATVKAEDLKHDLVVTSNNYMRQGLGSAEALEKAKKEILDTAEEIALFNQYLKDEVTEAEAAQRLETLRATNQIETGAAMTVSRPSGMPSNVPASAVNQTTYNITYTNGMTPYEQRKNTQQLKEYESLYSS